ncbi:predicted GPI-anchored protein 58 [Phragmites australis]|uniref:predicted GPI-anchored protein 58 n=1 Tax=Phragmites australis TaxID=29695 RepID=UPI002D78F3EE|nr:predicted GPI-anchored protein 58 [Phragmites australis]
MCPSCILGCLLEHSLHLWEDWRHDWVYVDVNPHDRLALPKAVAEPHRPTWEAAPTEDERMRPVLNRIDDLRQAGLTSVMSSSSSSLSSPRRWPVAGSAKEGGRGGQSSGGESATEARSKAREPEDQGQADGATAGARANPPSEAGSTVAPQRLEGQSPPSKGRKADPGPKPQGPEFKIPESRWQYRGPKSMKPKDPAGDQRRPEVPRQAPAPEPSAPAPDPRVPTEPEP